MAKLLELKEAADKLGMTTDQLLELRQKGDIFGMKDGVNWKFKEDEVNRVLAERGGGSGDDFGFALGDDDSGDDMASILVSEQELGHSGDSANSTVIGKSMEPVTSAGDSDIKLADEPAASKSDVQLVMPGSDLNLGGSDIALAGTSDLKLTEDGGTGKASDSKLGLGQASFDISTDSSLDLGSDDDLVLGGSGGSGIGSDVTLGGGDSGINLASPADSGLSLEEDAIDLMGSSVDAFELPEDEDVIALSSEMADPDEATQLKADEEFLLSPAGDLGGDDSDSGSQVIALEDSEAFDENADTMLRPSQPAQPLVVEDDAGGMLGGDAFGAVPGATPAVTPAYAPAAPPEAPYSVWNVLGLLCCVMLLAIVGMLMTDLMRNMWAFDSDRVLSTGLMDSIISAFGM